MFNALEMGLDSGNILGIAILGNQVSVAYKLSNGKVTHQIKNIGVLQDYKNHSRMNNDFIAHIVENILPNVSNWGDNEEDYETALISKNSYLRALVASNGKYKEILVEDEAPNVRIAVLLFLQSKRLMRRIRGDNTTDYSHIQGFEDTSYLDPLLDDPDYYVRFHLAKLGMDRHIKKLLHSSNADDVKIVLDTMPIHQLDAIISYGNNYIETLTIRGDNKLTKDQLEKIAQDRNEEIQLGLVKRGYICSALKNSPFKSVRDII